MKKILSLLLVFAMVLSFTACATSANAENPSPSGSSTPEKIETETVNPEVSEPMEAHYPVTVTSYNEVGEAYEQTFEKAPERIVSNQPQVTQLLLSLGLGDRIVAACESVGEVSEKYIDEFNNLNIIADNDSPAVELVIAQEPDFLIGWGSSFKEKSFGFTSEWTKRGVYTYIIENTSAATGSKIGINRTVEILYKDIANLGKIFNIEDKTDAMIADMQARISAITDITDTIAEEDKVNVLTVQIVYENEFFGRSATDFSSDLIKKAGGISLDNAFGKQSMENLIDANPDVILLIDRTDFPAQEKIDAIKAHPSLQEVPAVVNDRFVSVDYVEFYGGTYETVDVIEDIASQFYPDYFGGAKDDAQESHYPVTVETYNEVGEIVAQTFEKAPERVVSISQANTELLIALGLADKIIGTAHKFSPIYEVMAEQYNAIPFMVEKGYPSKEIVLDAQPDFLIGWGSLFAEKAMGAASEWHDRGIHTYLMNNTVSGLGPRTVDFLYDDILKLGVIFDVEDTAEAMVANMQERIAAIKNKTSQIPEDEKLNVVTLQYLKENEWLGRGVSKGGADFNKNLAELAGANHISEYGYQSLETLVALDPDYIIVIDMSSSRAADTIAAIKENPILKTMDCVKNDKFVPLDHVAFYCGGPRTIETIENLAIAFYPDIF